MEPTRLSSTGKQLFDRIEFDKEERLIHEIRKHPVGLFIIYTTGAVITGMILVITLLLPALIGPDSLGISSAGYNTFKSLVAVSGIVLSALSLIATAVYGYLYQAAAVIVTSEKIAQVLYKSLFNSKISQLSIGDVQDVTVTKKGILANMFDYGTLVVETAGEQQNYEFTFTPQPYESAKLIVGSHEENLKLYGN